MAKPTYYLWKDKDTNIEEFEKKKQKYIAAGFDVVIFNNTEAEGDIKEALLNIIKNHINDDY